MTYNILIDEKTLMSDEQICEMVNRHRFLIIDEMTAWSHKINKNYPAEKLQKKVNDEKWIEFAKWFKEIRDE
jgi:hypothetical protein